MDFASIRRVAILVDSLDQATAARLLAQMPATRAIEVRRAITELQDVDPLERKMAIAEFLKKSNEAKQPTPQTPDPVPSEALETPSPLDFLQRVSSDSLAQSLANEHPQTVAVVLSTITASEAAQLLTKLPPSLRTDALGRLARMGTIPQPALDEIGIHLQTLVNNLEPTFETTTQPLVSILSQLDGADRGEVISELTVSHPELASRLPITLQPETQAPIEKAPLTAVSHHEIEASQPTSNQTIGFDVIQRLPADRIRRVLAEVDTDTAMLAICGMDPQILRTLLSILPRDASKAVQYNMKNLRSVDIGDIDAAQQRVCEAAQRLCDAGRLPELPSFDVKTSTLSFAA